MGAHHNSLHTLEVTPPEGAITISLEVCGLRALHYMLFEHPDSAQKVTTTVTGTGCISPLILVLPSVVIDAGCLQSEAPATTKLRT